MTAGALAALLKSAYDADFSTPELLREGGGETYAAFCGGAKYLVKYIPASFVRSAERAAELISFLSARGVPTPRLVPAADGSLFVRAGEGLLEVFDFIEGRDLEPGEEPEAVGDAVGRMHAAMAAYTGELAENGRDFYLDRYLRILRAKGCGESLYKAYANRADALWSRVAALPRGVSHGDLYVGNLLLSGGRSFILDFDTACRGFLLHDLMAACNCLDYFYYKDADFSKTAATYEAFLRGYEPHRRLSREERLSVFDMMAVYHYQLQATIIEIHGLDCVGLDFVESQNDWLDRLERDSARWKRSQ